MVHFWGDSNRKRYKRTIPTEWFISGEIATANGTKNAYRPLGDCTFLAGSRLVMVHRYFGMEVHLFIILFGSMYSTLLAPACFQSEESERRLSSCSEANHQDVRGHQKLAEYVIYVTLFTGIPWFGSLCDNVAYQASFDKATVLGPRRHDLLGYFGHRILGLLGSVFVTQNRTVYSAALGLVLGLYALQIVSDVSEKASFLRFITPFKGAFPADILPRGGVDPVSVALAAIVIRRRLQVHTGSTSQKDIAVQSEEGPCLTRRLHDRESNPAAEPCKEKARVRSRG